MRGSDLTTTKRCARDSWSSNHPPRRCRSYRSLGRLLAAMDPQTHHPLPQPKLVSSRATVGEVLREDNPDSSFMRGYLWALIPSLALWAGAIFLVFSVFR